MNTYPPMSTYSHDPFSLTAAAFLADHYDSFTKFPMLYGMQAGLQATGSDVSCHPCGFHFMHPLLEVNHATDPLFSSPAITSMSLEASMVSSSSIKPECAAGTSSCSAASRSGLVGRRYCVLSSSNSSPDSSLSASSCFSSSISTSTSASAFSSSSPSSSNPSTTILLNPSDSHRDSQPAVQQHSRKRRRSQLPDPLTPYLNHNLVDPPAMQYQSPANAHPQQQFSKPAELVLPTSTSTLGAPGMNADDGVTPSTHASDASGGASAMDVDDPSEEHDVTYDPHLRLSIATLRNQPDTSLSHSIHSDAAAIPRGVHTADPRTSVVGLESMPEVTAYMLEEDRGYVLRLAWTNIMTFPVRCNVVLRDPRPPHAARGDVELMMMPGKTLIAFLPLHFVDKFVYFMANERIVEDFRKLAEICMKNENVAPQYSHEYLPQDIDVYLMRTYQPYAVMSATNRHNGSITAAARSTFCLTRKTHRGEAVWHSLERVDP